MAAAVYTQLPLFMPPHLAQIPGAGLLSDNGYGITHYSEFSGCGGTTDGADQVPWVRSIAAANHDADAIKSHELNFPHAKHFQEDLTKLDIIRMPWCHLFTASPACPAWTTANGMKRDFDKANAENPMNDPEYDDDETDPKILKRREKDRQRRKEYRRSRLLMKEVPRYLRAMIERGKPVPIGWMENVTQVRLWHEWDAWLGELIKMDYEVRVIAFNSMHARPVRCKRAPQSRNRCYVAFWHKSIGRTPDWDKWLRPKAFCHQCLTVVDAVQIFKDPKQDMGNYGPQYFYQCPVRTCRAEVKPEVLPALAAIDLNVPGIRIGDRPDLKMPPLAEATLARIAAGIRRYWLPLLTPVGGTWRGDGELGARPLNLPMPARTTRETDAVAVPPLVPPLSVPVEGRPGKTASPMTLPIRTQTTRLETGVALPPPPFMISLRGGGCKLRTTPVSEPLDTVTASGNHAGFVMPPLVMRNNSVDGGDPGRMSTPASEPMRSVTANGTQSLVSWQRSLLVPFYGGSDSAYPATGPVGTMTTRDSHGLANHTAGVSADFEAWERELSGSDLVRALSEVLFRMLEPHEVGAAMAFRDDYLLAPTAKKRRVRLYGNAVTPPVAEIITSALVECLLGEELPRELTAA